MHWSIFFYFDLVLIYKPWVQLTEHREKKTTLRVKLFVPENSYIKGHIYYDALGRNSNQLFPCTEFRVNRSIFISIQHIKREWLGLRWWCTLIIPVLWRQKQVNLCEFGQPGLYSKRLTQKQSKRKSKKKKWLILIYSHWCSKTKSTALFYRSKKKSGSAEVQS